MQRCGRFQDTKKQDICFGVLGELWIQKVRLPTGSCQFRFGMLQKLTSQDTLSLCFAVPGAFPFPIRSWFSPWALRPFQAALSFLMILFIHCRLMITCNRSFYRWEKSWAEDVVLVHYPSKHRCSSSSPGNKNKQIVNLSRSRLKDFSSKHSSYRCRNTLAILALNLLCLWLLCGCPWIFVRLEFPHSVLNCFCRNLCHLSATASYWISE